MKLYKVGEKSKAICGKCEQLRATTFRERDVPLSSGGGIVEQVLVAVCDVCDEVVSVPHQSVPRIKETLRKERRAVEARIPRQLSDVLGLVCQDLGFGVDSAPVVFRYYVRRAAADARVAKRLGARLNSEEASGKATARFSAKLDEPMFERLQEIVKTAGLAQSEVVKGLILQMKEELLDKPQKAVRKNLQDLMECAA